VANSLGSEVLQLFVKKGWRWPRWVGAVVMVTLLSACYPTYNWRELPIADGLATLAFPSRVETASRSVSLAGQPVQFTLTTTQVNDIVFSAGYAQLPADRTQQQVLEVRKALVQTLAASVGQQAPPQAYESEVFRLEADTTGQPLVMVARVLVHHDVALRVVASGPPEVLTDEIAKEFMQSLRLR
jgi:hypothetical protein